MGESGCLVPIGVPAGIVSGFEGVPDGGGLVRFADRLIALDPAEYRIWDAIAVAPKPAAFRAWSKKSSVADSEEHLRGLGKAGLVAHWRLDDHAEDLADRYAITFMGRFLGNGLGRTGTFRLGDLQGRPRVKVDLVTYECLLWSGGRDSITACCARVHSTKGANDHARHVIEAVPALMRSGMVRLDASTADGKATQRPAS